MTVATLFYVLALAIWVGTQVFFLAATSTLFGGFDRSLAGEVVTALFPVYYRFGYVTNGMAALLALVRWRAGAPLGRLAFLLALLLLGGTLYGGLVLRPEVHAAGEALQQATGETAPALEARFGRLHGLSMLVNALTLVLALALLALATLPAAPRRPGRFR